MTSPERRFRRGAANDEQEAFILLHQCGLGTAQRHRNHMAGMQPGHDGLRAHELPPSAPVRAAAKTPFGCVPRSRCYGHTQLPSGIENFRESDSKMKAGPLAPIT